jgi:hypothetical protein
VAQVHIIATLPVMTNISIAPVTRDVLIHTLTQLSAEAAIKDNGIIGNCFFRRLEIATLLYDWAFHIMMLCVGYNAPMFSHTDDKMVSIFNAIID